MLPLLLGATAIAAIFLSGCSKKEEPTPNPPSPPKTPEPEEKDLSYSKSCFVNPSCSEKEKSAAALDYLGTVYGEKGMAKYDGILTPNERKYVEGKFGEISEAKLITPTLSSAQDLLFSKSPRTPYQSNCGQMEMYHLLRGSDPKLGETSALGGRHFCGNEWGLIYLLSGLEAEVAADPENWVFFIEESEADKFSSRSSDFGIQETEFFDQIADRLHIPTFNPLHSIDSEAVISEMEKKGMSRADYAAILGVGKILEMAEYKGASDPEYQNLPQDKKGERLHDFLRRFFLTAEVQNYVEELPKPFGVDAKTFREACKKLIELPKGVSPDQHLRKLGKRVKETLEACTEISNKLSTGRSREILEKTGKRKAFFQMGALHLPLVKDLYSKTREVGLNEFIRTK